MHRAASGALSAGDISKRYRELRGDNFPATLEIAFISDDKRRQTLRYQKMAWQTPHGLLGVRYGENPEQPAAFYRLVDGNVEIAGVMQVVSNGGLVSAAELLQSGKHPSKTNLTDIDVALQILRYLQARPTVVIMKHTNPCAVASGDTLAEALTRAHQSDPVAAFGGSYIFNRAVDADVAEILARWYCEVVAAPTYCDRALDLLRARANLRIFRIESIERLADYIPRRYLDWRTLMDGGLFVQWGYHSTVLNSESFKVARARRTDAHPEVRSLYGATPAQLDDLLFGWHIVEALSSNAVLFAKQQRTVGIGCGSLDRVGAVRMARDRAYGAFHERMARRLHGCSFDEVPSSGERARIVEEAHQQRADLDASVMVSDAFFPFPDAVTLGLQEGAAAVAEPGGAQRDREVIACCNRYRVPLLFTEQRAFRH